ncbi:D-alanine--poly(phosphoribitol) ligase subunit DltA [Methanobrevibacter sp.]|uniref:D-alanine--poly(phosphoribitol) ligase subunit DltA n=1 Tax=Methanobrevibacter sp. TaxID=66852 RepID=UPI00386D6A30
MNLNDLSTKIITEKLIFKDVSNAKTFFKNQILEIEEESIITPDLNGDEFKGSIHRISSFIDNGKIVKFCNDLNIDSRNLFFAVSSFVLSKFVYNKNLIFSNSGVIEDNSFEDLPVILNLDTDLDVKSFLIQINDVWLNSLIYNDALTKTVDEFGFNPKFLYQFNCQNKYVEEKYNIVLTILEDNNAFEIICKFNDQLYSPELINTFLNGISIVINKITKLTEEEFEAVLLSDISILNRDVPNLHDLDFVDIEESVVHRIFEKQVDLHGDEVILTSADGDFTYDDLNDKSNRIANALINKGVSVEDRIMFILKRDSNVFATIFGVLKAGACFIPIDSDYPEERIEHVLTDSESKFIIYDDIVDIKGLDLSSYSDKLLNVEELLKEENTSNPDVDVYADNLAYMIYTSGSTGLPKGVMIEHGNFSNFVTPNPASSYCYELVTNAEKENYKVLAMVTVAFDTFLEEAILPILNNVPVVFADDNQFKDPLALIDLIKDTGANVFDGTPSRLLQYLEIGGLRELICDFKIFVVGGEGFPKHLYDILSKVSDGKIYNSYGPTEITIVSNDKLIVHPNVVSVGGPIFNVYEEIMDMDSNPLPPNVLGELYVAGKGVSREYHNRPENNAEAFMYINGIKFYRTGDLAKWDENGEVQIIGRLDDQIKLRGLRIEIGEIESAIKEFDGIKSLAVVVKKIKENDHLCAYYTTYGESIDLNALKQHLNEKLTYYMVPTVYMELDEIPQTANGKTDIRNLPEPILSTENVMPENDVQRKLYDMCSDILDFKDFGVTDNLFSLGFSSLSVMKLSHEIYSQFNIVLTFKTLMDAENICDLEDLLNSANEAEKINYEKQEYYPLSHNQLNVYIESVKNPDKLIYNMAFVIEMGKDLNPDKLKKSLIKVFNHHSYLKSIITQKDGDVYIKRQDDAEVSVNIVNKQCSEKLQNNFIRPFNLIDSPLYRAEIYNYNNQTTLLLDIHHIIFDGISLNIFIENLINEYQGNDLLKEEYTGFEYILEDYRQESLDSYKESEEFFNSKINEIDISTDISPNITKPIENAKLGEYYIPMSKKSVDKYCKDYNITPNNLFLSATLLTLSKYTYTKDMLIATISSGRLNPNYENTLAMVVKTLPFIHRIDTTQNVSEYFDSVQDTLTETINHENYPYTKLFEKHNINPNIYYAYQVGVDEEEEIINDEGKINTLNIKEVSLDLPKFNLSVYIEEDKDNYQLFLRYNDSLYSYDLIVDLAKNIELMVKKLQEDFNKSIGTISLLPSAKEDELSEIHKSFEDIKISSNLSELFEEAVGKFGEDIALVDNDEEFSYNQLNSEVNKIANSLIDLGISSGDHIILKLERSAKLIATIYAVIKTGASFTIVSTEQPEDQTEFIRQDTNAKLIIQSNIDELLDNENDANLNVNIKSDDIVCIVYTSGSTGKPKGVKITHKGLINYINPRKDNIAIHAIQNDVSNMLSLTTTTFIAFLREVLATIINGTKVTLAGDEESKNLSKLIRLIKKSHVDGLSLTPSRIQEYMKVTEFKDLLNQFKVITIGGEKFIPSVYSDIVDCSDAKIFNSYGSSENTIATHQKLISNDEITEGTPIPNNIDLIIDIDGNPLPNNIIGEICTAGVQTSPGYLNRDDLNESEFIIINNLRFYKTGDLAYKNSNDELVIIGRKDNQIKLRGQRIEPGEIESVISKYSGIESVAVTVKQINNQDNLCAYYTGNRNIDVGELKEYLLTKLIRYMIPTSFTQLDSMPKTPNGKIDIKNLPDPKISTELVSAENELEESIFEICAEIAGFNDFGVTDNLYELGFTSLTIMRLSTEIYNKLDKEINVTIILQQPTIRGIAENIELNEGLSDVEDEVSEEKPQYYKLTPNQLGVYFDCVKDLEKVTYNLPKYIELGSGIDENRLKSAIINVINSHPYLKTRIIMNDGVVYQERRDDLIIDDLIEIIEVDDGIDDKFKEDFIKPFDLSEGPLFRFKIIKDKENTALLSDFHHIILDGTSLNILFSQIASSYDNPDLEFDENELEPLNGFDYSQKEVKIQESSHYKEAEMFFLNKIKEHDEGSLISPDLNGSEEDGEAAEEFVRIDKDEVDNFCKEISVTPNNLFLSISSFVLSKFVNNKNLLFATITNGRFTPDEQNTLAMMVKTLPLSLKLNADLNFKEYFEYINKEWVNTLSYSSYPLTNIVDKYGIVPEFIYAFDGKIIEDIEINGKMIERESLEYDDLKFKLNLDVTEIEDTYQVTCEYNDALYTPKLIKTFIDSINIVLNKLIKFTSQELENIFLKDVSIIEREVPYVDELEFVEIEEPLIHKIFEKQVNLNGEKVILTASDGDFTFNDLNENANRIANALIRKGVGIEDKIMFILKRESNVFTSILGILKSGACFIPIDSDYPANRIEHVLTDSESKYIIYDDIVDIKGLDLSSYSDKLVHVDELLEEENTTNPNVEIASNNLAYMIYTSGSTGLPKGVMIEHRNFANFITPNPDNSYCYELVTNAEKENYKILGMVTVAFDTFLDETMLPMLNGVPVVFANDDQFKDSLSLIDLIKNTGANVFDGTPSRLLQYLEIDVLKDLIADFKIFVVGGEGFPKHLYDILSKVSDGKIFNSYGPTEITIACNDKLIDQPNVVSVGGPMFNVYEEIMDMDANPLPPHVLGELYVAGKGVSRSYYNRPENNAKSFKTINGIRFYRTGDLAKWDDNGEVEILGRLDDQIKLRGLRIEIGEIESAIKEFEGIKSLAVVVKKIKGNDHLCAYFTVYDEYKSDEDNYSIDIDALKEHLNDKLTYYMVPTVYMELDELPQTLNGKTDLRNLPEPVLITEYVAPENDVEAFFADTFAEILSLDQVGVTDNFFEIGGTSLLVTKITIAALNRDFSISYGDVFDNPTPRKLAEFILTDENLDVSLSEEFNYDYTEINKLLDKNTLDNLINGELENDLGNILLTGATGFLGIHILKELLDNTDGDIYCLIRSRTNLSSEERLKSLLYYYFSINYEELFAERLHVIDGDITNYADFEKLIPYDIDTIFNCAANVKHFSSGTDIEDINLGGVINGLKFAKIKNAKYVQVSTYSVAGESINNFPPEDYLFNEKDLFIGQSIDNQYISSKFLAERAVLEAAVEDDLTVKIMRVGNLMARSDDGEFQINFNSNGFINQLKAFVTIGKMPYSMLSDADELSPIDVVAKSIVELSKTPKECVVFHPYQHHTICFGDIIDIIKPLGLKIDPVEEDEYEMYLNEVLNDDERQEGVSGLLTSIGSGKFKKIWIEAENEYTIQALYRLGVKWPIISQEYIYKFIEYLNDLAFFD